MADDLLKRAIALIQNGQRAEARPLLIELLKREPAREIAWLWLADTFPDRATRLDVLRQSLKYNPDSVLIRKALEKTTGPLITESPQPVEAPPTPAKPASQPLASPAEPPASKAPLSQPPPAPPSVPPVTTTQPSPAPFTEPIEQEERPLNAPLDAATFARLEELLSMPEGPLTRPGQLPEKPQVRVEQPAVPAEKPITPIQEPASVREGAEPMSSPAELPVPGVQGSAAPDGRVQNLRSLSTRRSRKGLRVVLAVLSLLTVAVLIATALPNRFLQTTLSRFSALIPRPAASSTAAPIAALPATATPPPAATPTATISPTLLPSATPVAIRASSPTPGLLPTLSLITADNIAELQLMAKWPLGMRTMISPSGKLAVATNPQGDILVYNGFTGHLYRTIPGRGVLTRWLFLPDDRTLAVAWDDRVVHLFELTTGQEISSLSLPLSLLQQLEQLSGKLPPEVEMAVSPDGRQLAVSTFLSISLWDLSNGQVRQIYQLSQDDLAGYPFGSLEAGAPRWAARPLALAFSPDGKWLAAGGENRPLVVIQRSNDSVAVLDRLDADFHSLVFSPGGQLFEIGINYLQQRETKTGKRIGFRAFYRRMSASPPLTAFSNDGKYLAAETEVDGLIEVSLVDLATGRAARRFNTGSVEPLTSLFFSPDSQLLAFGSGNTLQFINLKSGEAVLRLEQINGYMSGFGPGGYLIYQPTQNGLNVWGVTTDMNFRPSYVQPTPTPGWKLFTTADGLSSNDVYQVVAAPDGMIWVANGWLERFDGKRWTLYTDQNAPFQVNENGGGCMEDKVKVCAISAGADRILYANIGDGLHWFDGQKWGFQSLRREGEDTANIVGPLAADPIAGVWYLDFPWLTHFMATAPALEKVTLNFKFLFINAITVGLDRSVWFHFTDGDGKFSLARLQKDEVTQYGEKEGFTPDLLAGAMRTLATAPDGSIWYATSNANCLKRFDGENWGSCIQVEEGGRPLEDGLPGISGIAFSPDGTLWVSSSYGLYRYHGGSWSKHVEPGLGDDVPGYTGLAIASDGSVWLATGSQGLIGRGVVRYVP